MQQCHDEALLKLYEVINLYTGLNRLNMELQTKTDERLVRQQPDLVGHHESHLHKPPPTARRS